MTEEEESHKQMTNNRSKFYDELIATLPLEERWGRPLRYYQNFWYGEANLDRAKITPSLSQAHTIVSLSCDEQSLLPSNKLSSLPSPRLIAFHFPYLGLPKSALEANCRIVYRSRDPKDSLVSWWHFINKLRPSSMGPLPFSEAFEMFSKGISPFGPIWDHYAEYLQASRRHPDKVMMLKYEEIIEDGASNVKRLAEFMGCPFCEEEEERGVVEEIVKLCSFQNLSCVEINRTGVADLNLKNVHAKNSYFFREGKSNGWRNYMTMEMAQTLDSIVEQKTKAI